MSYVDSVLQPGERSSFAAICTGSMYWHAILFLVLGIVLVAWESSSRMGDGIITFTTMAFGVLFVVAFLHGWFQRWITEFAVTDRRVIYKRGFITRHTVEMNMDKVASVDVDQSVLGRMLGYGTVYVKGTGQGFEPILCRISNPIAFRNAITAK